MANRPPRKLLEMLTYKRPYGGPTDEAWIERFIAPTGAQPDDFGNWILRIGTAPVMWSCHTDTVHWTEGRQNVTYDRDNVIRLHGASKEASKNAKAPNCLGADDAAGAWLLLQLIEARVEGLYVFHRGEECGAHGSTYITTKTPELVEGIKYAIAFDRRGTTSVITHQGGSRCCSDAFAESFIQSLGDFGNFKPDPTGLFTDTALYTDLIPECTNISVGYQFEHGWKEHLQADFLVGLAKAMLANPMIGQWVVDREPGEDDFDYGSCYVAPRGQVIELKTGDLQVQNFWRRDNTTGQEVYWCVECDDEYAWCRHGRKMHNRYNDGYEAPSRYLGSHAATDAEFVESEALDPAWEALQRDDSRDAKLARAIIRRMKGGTWE
jgi:hypothetical protein